jgi:hypothetical protein
MPTTNNQPASEEKRYQTPEPTATLNSEKTAEEFGVPVENIQQETQEPIVEKETQPEADKEKNNPLTETIGGLQKRLKTQKPKPTQIPIVKDKITLAIEKILEDDLADAYKELSPLQKQQFKIKGEKTAWEIRRLLKATHIKIKKILRLIFDWLRLLPGINRFFLEQEAKIKTDKIVALKKMSSENVK